MTLKKIEYIKREVRKALGRPDASERSCDNNAHFKVERIQGYSMKQDFCMTRLD